MTIVKSRPSFRDALTIREVEAEERFLNWEACSPAEDWLGQKRSI